MFSQISGNEVTRKIAELRYCVAELRRRQESDRLRAWLWQLKENAARQALAMLLRLRGDESSVNLSSADVSDLQKRHSLLIDPRSESPAWLEPTWKRTLHSRISQLFSDHLTQREPVASDNIVQPN